MAGSAGILEVMGMVLWVMATLTLHCGDDACSLEAAASWPGDG
jgi:hypothetical protein